MARNRRRSRQSNQSENLDWTQSCVLHVKSLETYYNFSPRSMVIRSSQLKNPIKANPQRCPVSLYQHVKVRCAVNGNLYVKRSGTRSGATRSGRVTRRSIGPLETQQSLNEA